MQSAIERRQQVLEAISDRRTERIENLASEFGVSRRTIERDILVLSCSYPIVTVQGAAGGVRAMDGWYVTRRYLNDDQEALLRSLLPGLQPDQQETMQRKQWSSSMRQSSCQRRCVRGNLPHRNAKARR